MARKSHFHASPIVLSLGLIAVMAFTIIMGVSQVRQNQSNRTSAEEVEGKEILVTGSINDDCDFNVATPWEYQSSVISSVTPKTSAALPVCESNVKTMSMIGWLTIDGNKQSVKTDSCEGDMCGEGGYGAYSKVNKLRGTHKYCGHAKVTFKYKDGSSRTIGPYRTRCKNYTNQGI